MPLSDHEQRMLEEIERALCQDDPKFVASVDAGRIRRRRPIISAIIFVIGLVGLVVGVIASQAIMGLGVAISVLGFLIMFGAVALFVYGQPGSRVMASPENKSKAPSSLSERMEERFRRRFDDGR